MSAGRHMMRSEREVAAQVEGPTGGLLEMTARPQWVPAHLLDGDEIVHFAIKPSRWFVLLVSARWLLFCVLIALIARFEVLPSMIRSYSNQLALVLAGGRVAWAILEWVSRLYVLTNRRVMRIRGVFNVELFECPLDRIQNTHLTLSAAERVMRVGTITFQTASRGGTASWRVIARPLEVHEKLRAAIARSKNHRGNHVA